MCACLYRSNPFVDEHELDLAFSNERMTIDDDTLNVIPGVADVGDGSNRVDFSKQNKSQTSHTVRGILRMFTTLNVEAYGIDLSSHNHQAEEWLHTVLSRDETEAQKAYDTYTAELKFACRRKDPCGNLITKGEHLLLLTREGLRQANEIKRRHPEFEIPKDGYVTPNVLRAFLIDKQMPLTNTSLGRLLKIDFSRVSDIFTWDVDEQKRFSLGDSTAYYPKDMMQILHALTFVKDEEVLFWARVAYMYILICMADSGGSKSWADTALQLNRIYDESANTVSECLDGEPRLRIPTYYATPYVTATVSNFQDDQHIRRPSDSDFPLPPRDNIIQLPFIANKFGLKFTSCARSTFDIIRVAYCINAAFDRITSLTAEAALLRENKISRFAMRKELGVIFWHAGHGRMKSLNSDLMSVFRASGNVVTSVLVPKSHDFDVHSPKPVNLRWCIRQSSDIGKPEMIVHAGGDPNSNDDSRVAYNVTRQRSGDVMAQIVRPDLRKECQEGIDNIAKAGMSTLVEFLKITSLPTKPERSQIGVTAASFILLNEWPQFVGFRATTLASVAQAVTQKPLPDPTLTGDRDARDDLYRFYSMVAESVNGDRRSLHNIIADGTKDLFTSKSAGMAQPVRLKLSKSALTQVGAKIDDVEKGRQLDVYAYDDPMVSSLVNSNSITRLIRGQKTIIFFEENYNKYPLAILPDTTHSEKHVVINEKLLPGCYRAANVPEAVRVMKQYSRGALTSKDSVELTSSSKALTLLSARLELSNVENILSSGSDIYPFTLLTRHVPNRVSRAVMLLIWSQQIFLLVLRQHMYRVFDLSVGHPLHASDSTEDNDDEETAQVPADESGFIVNGRPVNRHANGPRSHVKYDMEKISPFILIASKGICDTNKMSAGASGLDETISLIASDFSSMDQTLQMAMSEFSSILRNYASISNAETRATVELTLPPSRDRCLLTSFDDVLSSLRLKVSSSDAKTITKTISYIFSDKVKLVWMKRISARYNINAENRPLVLFPESLLKHLPEIINDLESESNVPEPTSSVKDISVSSRKLKKHVLHNIALGYFSPANPTPYIKDRCSVEGSLALAISMPRDPIMNLIQSISSSTDCDILFVPSQLDIHKIMLDYYNIDNSRVKRHQSYDLTSVVGKCLEQSGSSVFMHGPSAFKVSKSSISVSCSSNASLSRRGVQLKPISNSLRSSRDNESLSINNVILFGIDSVLTSLKADQMNASGTTTTTESNTIPALAVYSIALAAVVSASGDDMIAGVKLRDMREYVDIVRDRARSLGLVIKDDAFYGGERVDYLRNFMMGGLIGKRNMGFQIERADGGHITPIELVSLCDKSFKICQRKGEDLGYTILSSLFARITTRFKTAGYVTRVSPDAVFFGGLNGGVCRLTAVPTHRHVLPLVLNKPIGSKLRVRRLQLNEHQSRAIAEKLLTQPIKEGATLRYNQRPKNVIDKTAVRETIELSNEEIHKHWVKCSEMLCHSGVHEQSMDVFNTLSPEDKIALGGARVGIAKLRDAVDSLQTSVIDKGVSGSVKNATTAVSIEVENLFRDFSQFTIEYALDPTRWVVVRRNHQDPYNIEYAFKTVKNECGCDKTFTETIQVPEVIELSRSFFTQMAGALLGCSSPTDRQYRPLTSMVPHLQLIELKQTISYARKINLSPEDFASLVGLSHVAAINEETQQLDESLGDETKAKKRKRLLKFYAEDDAKRTFLEEVDELYEMTKYGRSGILELIDGSGLTDRNLLQFHGNVSNIDNFKGSKIVFLQDLTNFHLSLWSELFLDSMFECASIDNYTNTDTYVRLPFYYGHVTIK